jgi:hypothetical protein
MKYIYIIKLILVTVFISVLWTGCNEDFLDKSPVDIITEDIILSDISAYKLHLAFLYSQMPFESFDSQFLPHYTDETVNCTESQEASLNVNLNWFEEGYKQLRNLNNMIAKLPSSTAFGNEQEKTEALGELKLMRAFCYFRLAQVYGGVPIILDNLVLPESGDFTELYRPRDTEADVYALIEKEMDEAIAMLPEKNTAFQFNKWSALAIKSRAMLHAASIAKYGDVQLDGLVGIPSSQASHYFESARTAAQTIISDGPYSLFDQIENKQENYHQMFFDESNGNTERIFSIAYMWPEKGHNFDLYTAPFNHRSGSGYGGRYNPTLSMVEDYEYVDNPNGELELVDAEGDAIEYANPYDIFNNKDPRFFQSVLYPGAPWNGTRLDIYGEIMSNGVVSEGFGADGIAQPEGTSTGFYLAKWADREPARAIDTRTSEVDRMVIRYAEVLLNCAEAEMELENESEARKYVNMIRKRAGISEYDSPITMEQYRHERKIELAYEGNRYWDLKRWRIFHELVNNLDTYSLWPIKNVDTGGFFFQKRKLPVDKFTKTFDAKLYYHRIDDKTMNSNPLIVQNPGY